MLQYDKECESLSVACWNMICWLMCQLWPKLLVNEIFLLAWRYWACPTTFLRHSILYGICQCDSVLYITVLNIKILTQCHSVPFVDITFMHILFSCSHVYNRHDDVIKWKHFPRYWPFVRGIHRSPVNSPHKGQWRGALMFSLICARINDWGWWFETQSGSLWRYSNEV